MVELHLYVEGGGDTKLLRTACRKGFSEFLSRAGLLEHRPRIVACGGRQRAYDSFCTALRQGQAAMLLVDSEGPVTVHGQPWLHLKRRQGDRWEKPSGSSDSQCHLMVQCMENWLLADPQTLHAFFGQGFHAGALPSGHGTIESLDKVVVYQALADATRRCKTKAPYGKGEHSFKLLALIDPDKVRAASPWVHRFLTDLEAALAS